MVLHPLYTTGAYRWARTLIFLSLGCSAVIPVTHNLLMYGFARARDEMGLAWLLASGGLYIAGALLYAVRFPERAFPRTFDFFGSSHQIFHMAVVGAAYMHFRCITKAMAYHHGVMGGMCRGDEI
jgi:adiponectin receptor